MTGLGTNQKSRSQEGLSEDRNAVYDRKIIVDNILDTMGENCKQF